MSSRSSPFVTVPFPATRFLAVLLLAPLAPMVAAAANGLAAQDEDTSESYERFVDLVGSKYVPAGPESPRQTLRLQLNLSPDLPEGAKVVLELVHNGLPITGLKSELVVTGRQRLGVEHEWSLSQTLGCDDYRLQVTLDLNEQSEKVRRAFAATTKAFPPRLNPFTYPIFDPGKEIPIGTPEERTAQAERACKLYEAYINELLDNFNEFNDAVKQLRAGEKLHKAGKPDPAAYGVYIREWRRKQGATQRGIRQDLIEKHAAILVKTRTAHVNLIDLSAMVSKRALGLQKEAEKELGLAHVNPVPDPKEKKDADLVHWSASYRYAVTNEALNRSMDTIYRLVCPPAPDTDGDAGAPASGTVTGETESGTEPPGKDPPKGGDAPPKGGDAPPKGGDAPPKGGNGPPKGGDGPPKSGDGPPKGNAQPKKDPGVGISPGSPGDSR